MAPNTPYSVRWLSYDANGFVVAGGLSPAADRVELVRANGVVTVATTVEHTFAVRIDSDPAKESPNGMVLVSLKASARDTDGNSVDQTIIRAFMLK